MSRRRQYEKCAKPMLALPLATAAERRSVVNTPTIRFSSSATNVLVNNTPSDGNTSLLRVKYVH